MCCQKLFGVELKNNPSHKTRPTQLVKKSCRKKWKGAKLAKQQLFREETSINLPECDHLLTSLTNCYLEKFITPISINKLTAICPYSIDGKKIIH